MNCQKCKTAKAIYHIVSTEKIHLCKSCAKVCGLLDEEGFNIEAVKAQILSSPDVIADLTTK